MRDENRNVSLIRYIAPKSAFVKILSFEIEQQNKITENFELKEMTSKRKHDGVDETLEQLIEDLTCQLCGRSPRPEDQRWYRCSELHHICELCVEIRKMESIASCSCQAMISKKIDKVTEALMKLKTWKFKCRHCFESFAREDFDVHESGCDQRLVPCLVADYNETKCSLMVKLVDILLHFESTHQKISVCRSGVTYTTKGNCSKSNLTNFTLSPSKSVAYGKIFIRSAVTKDGVLYAWVKLIGPPSEAKEFMFSLEYNGSRSTHVYLGDVASVDETLDSIIKSGKCSSIGFESFKHQFMKGNTSKFSSSVTIKKIDE